MNTHPIRRWLSAPRTRGLALAGSALALLTMFCLQLAVSNRDAWQAVLEPGPASVDEALAAVCGSLALALSLWLLSALLLSLLAALGSGTSALSAALATGARVLAPRALRNAVAALIGVAIATAPAVAVAAEGSAPAPTPAQVHNTQGLIPDGRLSPAWAPAKPRDSTIRGDAAAHGNPAPRSDLLPQWLPHRPPRPAESAPMVSTARRAGVDQDDEIVVRRGDTLWNLAERHLGPGATDGEIALEWPHWFTANRAVIGSDPDHLVPGERLRPPERNAYAGPYLSGTTTDDTTATKTGARTGARTGPKAGAKGSAKARPEGGAKGSAKARPEGGAKVSVKTSAKADVEHRGAR